MVDDEPVNIPNKRPKGSTGIDIAIFKPAKPQTNPVLLIDLKTGRPWSKAERNRIVKGLGGRGVPIEIMVSFRK
jgi:hypothetical protein